MNRPRNEFPATTLVPTPRGERGVALVLVLWVLVLISVLVAEFCQATRVELTVTRNFKERTESHYVARAGITAGMAALAHGSPPLLEGFPARPPAEWPLETFTPPVPFADGEFRLMLGNEAGKINLNRSEEPLLKQAFIGLGLKADEAAAVAAAILDWRDDDEFARVGGAETQYYARLDPPYAAKNADFDTVAELTMIRGIGDRQFPVPLEEIFTVVPRHPTKKEAETEKGWPDAARVDYGRISLNAAPPAVLGLLPGMTDDAIRRIIEVRRRKSFAAVTELSEILEPEMMMSITPWLALKRGPVHVLRARGVVADGAVTSDIEVMVFVDPARPGAYEILRWLDEPAPLPAEEAS